MKLTALNVTEKDHPVWGSLNQTSDKTWFLYISETSGDKRKAIKIELKVEE